MAKTSLDGLLDGVAFPPRLDAWVVAPEADPRIHGYAVQAELGHRVGFVDVVWLSLTGELPTELEREAVSRALVWLAPMHAGEGPTHAGILARIAGAPDAVTPAVATVALGQHIGAELIALDPVFAWLERTGDRGLARTDDREPPASALEPEPTQGQRDAWLRLCADCARWFGGGAPFRPERPWRRIAAAYSILYKLGIRDHARLHALATLARLPVVLAEAACTVPGSVTRYPTLAAPPFQYVEDR